jgi:tetratricopeptide (TPR) repeat protein
MVEKSRSPLSRLPGISLAYLLLFAGFAPDLHAQPGTSTADLPKPKKFENRVLASEKSTTTKMNVVKRWNQNLNTRFNFEYNAATKLDNVLESARQSFREDYSKLLPFYNYSLDVTSTQDKELDSVIHKCNNGILLHDLRGDWIDDLYLLMGQSYFLKKDFDSAAIAFQFINYAFQPRSKDEVGYDKFIGSNLNNTGNVYTVSTPESKNAIMRAVKHTPARNEAILWLVRTLIELNRMGDAWGLIETLQRDQNFPSYMKPQLHEMQALWYYQRQQPDSAAVYLEKALPAAGSAQERARWEYLSAQLYEQAGNKEDAARLLDKAIQHTTDPILEAYARIAEIRLATGDDEAERIRLNIEALMKMARKAKYEEYRHIIYYAAGSLELKRPDSAAALADFRKSIEYNTTDDAFKNSTFLDLADLAFDMEEYRIAAAYYDSANLSSLAPETAAMIELRKSILGDIVFHMENIRVEDSLQKIAAMPEAERDAYLKGLSRKLRKERGLKEEESASTGTAGVQNRAIQDNEAPDLFNSNTSKAGEWYFYNSSLKSQGKRKFDANWGNRPNQDNWRRMAAVNAQANAVAMKQSMDPEAPPADRTNTKTQPEDISTNGLRANLPLTAEAMEISRDTIQFSLYSLGKTFHDRLGDCTGSIRYYEELLNRFPETPYQEEALFVLTRCYQEAGNTAKANFYKGFLVRNHSQGKYLKYLNNPVKLKEESQAFNKAATGAYDDVYNLFIEGKFDEALERKKKADSTYGDHFWSPQLLYIESVYYIRQRQDSLALATLNKIIALYPQSNMNERVSNLMSVVSRRAEIEAYLTNLDVQRIPEDSIAIVEEVVVPKEREKVAPREKPAREPVVAAKTPIATGKDSVALKAPPKTVETKKGYQFIPTLPHFVILVLEKVDPVYVNEARTALNRYNREKFYQQPLELTPLTLTDEIRLVQVGTFADAVAAMEYLEKARAASASDIFPWLTAGKYSYLLISADNLELLKTEKNMETYRQFLKQQLPGKF